MVSFIKSMGRELVKWKRMQKAQDGGNKTLLISILKMKKLHVLLFQHISTVVCTVYIWLFRLIIYVLCSVTHTFSNIYIGLLFTRTVCSMAWIFYLVQHQTGTAQGGGTTTVRYAVLYKY